MHFAWKISGELCDLLNIRRFHVKPKPKGGFEINPDNNNLLIKEKNASHSPSVNADTDTIDVSLVSPKGEENI